jgi:endonuclease V-like protein UPF0215 family
MIRSFGAIKKETRILGLDKCNPRLTVGVVVRGGSYLDGVISFPPDSRNNSRESARRIATSAYFPELRAIMIHTQSYERESASVERITNLPTMAIMENEPSNRQGYKRLDGNLGELWVRTRVESTILKKILTASWTMGKLPEPLRVAHLLAKADLPKPRDKE